MDEMIKVDFMIIGSMKTGTTSLCHALENHPDVLFSNPKETDFFFDVNWRNRKADYNRYFTGNSEGKKIGEGSTTYTMRPKGNLNISRDLWEYNPHLKFIYIIRHPIDRIKSHYVHAYLRGYEKREMNKAIREREFYTQVSSHYSQIKPYVDTFGLENILILRYEDLVNSWESSINSIQKFIGLTNVDLPLPSLNRTKGSVRYNHKITDFLTNKWANTYKYILPKPVRSSIGKAMMRMGRKRWTGDGELSLSSRDFIWRKVEPDLEKLASVIGYDSMYEFK